MSERFPEHLGGMELILLPPQRHRSTEELSPEWQKALEEGRLIIQAMEKAIAEVGAQMGTSEEVNGNDN